MFGDSFFDGISFLYNNVAKPACRGMSFAYNQAGRGYKGMIYNNSDISDREKLERKTLRSLNLLGTISEKYTYNLQNIDDKDLQIIRNKAFRRNLAISGTKSLTWSFLFIGVFGADIYIGKNQGYKDVLEAFTSGVTLALIPYVGGKFPQDGKMRLKKELVEKITAPPEKPSGTELE